MSTMSKWAPAQLDGTSLCCIFENPVCRRPGGSRQRGNLALMQRNPSTDAVRRSVGAGQPLEARKDPLIGGSIQCLEQLRRHV